MAFTFREKVNDEAKKTARFLETKTCLIHYSSTSSMIEFSLQFHLPIGNVKYVKQNVYF